MLETTLMQSKATKEAFDGKYSFLFSSKCFTPIIYATKNYIFDITITNGSLKGTLKPPLITQRPYFLLD